MIDKDDFWNIDRILPKSNSNVNKNIKVEAVEISTDTVNKVGGVDIKSLFHAVNEKKSANFVESCLVKEHDYTHFTDSHVISYAYVAKYNNTLSYDNKMRAYALSLYSKKTVKQSQFVEYFSFKPSFAELSSEQLDYYISWRDDIRQGIFNKTCASYVILFISEIVNLPDKIKPSVGLDLIVNLWDKCLDDSHKREKVISDVLFEYCIVHNLQIPYEKLKSIVYNLKNPITNIIGSLYIFDYLLISKTDFTKEDLRFIFEKNLSFCFSSGKHYNTNSKLKSLLDNYFYKVLSAFISKLPECISQIYDKHENRSSPVKITRPTFLLVNASSEIKRNIVFEYNCFDKSDAELLYLVNIAKNIENRFRSICGIRARLTVTPLDPRARSVLDNIFNSLLSIKQNTDTQYKEIKVKKIEIDFERAQKIEKVSWETTKMLTDGIDVFEHDDFVDNNTQGNTGRLTDIEKIVLTLILNGNSSGAVDECRKSGVFLDAVITNINEKALDCLGDIIIDTDALSVYEEYIDEISYLLE